MLGPCHLHAEGNMLNFLIVQVAAGFTAFKDEAYSLDFNRLIDSKSISLF
jgi:hypothetical protein